MKKLIAMMMLVGTAACAVDEYVPDAPIQMPSIVRVVPGNGGRVSFDTVSRVWRIDLDAVLSDGDTRSLSSVEVSQEEVYAALSIAPVPATWEAALVTFQTALRAIAIRKAVQR